MLAATKPIACFAMLTDDCKAASNDAAPTHGAIYNRLTDICLNKCADVDSILVAFSGHGALDVTRGKPI